MFACQRIATTLIAKRSFYTAPAILAESEGLFGKLNPWAKKQQQPEVTPAQHTSQDTPQVTFNVKYQDAEEIVSWKKNQVLTDATEIESTVKSAILQHVEGATEINWKELPINDLQTKFKILKDSMKETGKEVPNYELNQIETTNDVLAYFQREERLVEKVTIEDYFQENTDSLPANLTFAPRE